MVEQLLGSALAERPGDVLAACLCTNLRKASRVATQRFDAALKDCGVTVNQLALLLACAGPAGTTTSAVSTALAVDRSTLTRTLRPLIERGLIERRSGGRSRRLSLTEAGRQRVAEALPRWAEAERALAEAIGWPTTARLLADLGQITATGHGG